MITLTESLEPNRPIVIWRVAVVFLERPDWKYEKSKAGEAGGGRTHTFGVRKASKRLQGCAVYRRSDVVLQNGKPVPVNGNGHEDRE